MAVPAGERGRSKLRTCDRALWKWNSGGDSGTQFRIPDGEHTRIIELPGERRIIQSVDLWYSKGKWEKQPKVSL
jgi:hypothetical protein